MAIAAASIKFYQCATWSEGASHGGDIDTGAEIVTATDQNIFDDVSNSGRIAGETNYRKIYLRNENADTWLSVSGWIDQLTPASNDEVSIILGTNGEVQSDVTGYSFVSPSGKLDTDALLVGDLAQNEYQAVWIKRIVSAAGDGYTENNFKLDFESS